MITDVHSAGNAARYLACGCCCISLQHVAIHQQYDWCQESPSLFRIYSKFLAMLECNGTAMNIDHRLEVYWDSNWAAGSADCNSQGGLCVSCDHCCYRLVVSNAMTHCQINSPGKAHCILEVFQTGKMITPIAKEYLRYSQILTTASNQLLQPWYPLPYHPWHNQSSN